MKKGITLILALLLMLLALTACAGEQTGGPLTDPITEPTTDPEESVTEQPAPTPTVVERTLFSSNRELSFADMRVAATSNNPVAFKQNVNDVLEGTTVTRIGVPVMTVSDPTKDCKTEVYLMNTSSPAVVLATYPLVIPANTYTSTAVNEWVYFDVDIKIHKGEILAFGSTKETIRWGYASTGVPAAEKAVAETRGCMVKLGTASSQEIAHSLLFDIEYKTLEGENMNLLKDKYISILGASTSTYNGYSNSTLYNSTIGGNANYYVSKVKVDETWWMKTINELDMKLCVNNSWSGSCVSTAIDANNKAGCMDRATQLHNDILGIDPDVIVLIIGGNDALKGLPVGTYTDSGDIYDANTGKYIGDCTKFAQAYATLVHKVKNRYPDASVYVCSMLHWQPKSGSNLLEYNDAIKKIADEFDVTYVDFYNGTDISPATKDTYLFTDGVHPNAAGFAQMSHCIVEVLKDTYKK